MTQDLQKNVFENDAVMQNLGVHLDHYAHKTAQLSLTITTQHTQGHGTCHGGIIFTLADGAFAVACNSETTAVGQHCTISYLKPAKVGDTLTAKALFKAPSGRSEIYDITLTNQHNEIIAEFRGVSRMAKKIQNT
ncbi:hydroxyphenylacetyl-CoA thioesterase PaaI [Acinetobacter piscicola]|uniref:hydroxyphenylacetyl-CoA thioesterase PaaI n=1 Tax=Acinetobacter piscicola TaxID=2006115 RepID=UPI00101F90DE|nr:hydroxyphenylacetyl-CoA thioesterase PaaI [Acinetobacter piscicola]RYL27618.1 hydroxyphenylacetyl-CoA thioesterase PaaI [Acinetobacter piscicola]